jgi:putative two-component system response regulator
MGTPTLTIDAVNGSLILIVDDIAANLSVLGELLHQSGYQVRIATSGRTALRYATQEPRPALILLDVMMPEMNGYQVLAA